MRRVAALLLVVSLASLWGYGAWRLRQQAEQAQRLASAAGAAEQSLPREYLWVWERPEDLHALDPQRQGAAILQGTLHLGRAAVFTPRRNAYSLPQGTPRIAVVRIEARPDFATQHDSAEVLKQAEASLVAVARRGDSAALQIDFDARRSERAFYRRLLTGLRSSMPHGLPLEITALVSWCDEDDWIGGLPINSATPMFFRMEPGRARFARSHRLSAQLPEGLCNGSVGVSTHEPWPTGMAGRRVYVFADGGWARDFTLLADHSMRAEHAQLLHTVHPLADPAEGPSTP